MLKSAFLDLHDPEIFSAQSLDGVLLFSELCLVLCRMLWVQVSPWLFGVLGSDELHFLLAHSEPLVVELQVAALSVEVIGVSSSVFSQVLDFAEAEHSPHQVGKGGVEVHSCDCDQVEEEEQRHVRGSHSLDVEVVIQKLVAQVVLVVVLPDGEDRDFRVDVVASNQVEDSSPNHVVDHAG